MKNKFIKLSFSLLAVMLMFSCENDENYTGDSTLSATSPSVTVSLGFTSTQTLVEQKASYDFTVTLNEIQVVDVVVNLEQTGGTATNGEDFTMPSTVTIPSGTLSASDVITILEDELLEDTETATILIGTGSEVNVSGVTGQTVTFNISNLTEDDLAIGLSWDATITKVDGTVMDPTDAADLRLLITDSPYSNIIAGADGATFESYTMTSATPDGEYLLVADFYAAYDLGAQGSFDVGVTATFDQVGVINGQTHTFPAALNTEFICANNYYVLAKIIKSGSNYSIEEIGENNFEAQKISWTMGSDVIDTFVPAGYASAVVTEVDCVGTKIKGLNKSWMESTWGEEIIEEGDVYYTTDASGNITINSQYAFTTVYNGAEYRYTVSGNGTWDTSGATPVLVINYYLDQDGFSPNGWMFANGYMNQDYFIATVMP